MAEVHYEGSYVPLKGLEMSAAMASTLDISFDIRGGLLMRQIHHWAALLFVASIGLHMLRVFFTGAFRKPREINWVVGFLLFILAMAEGFTGYSLPDDLLSGNGLRIIDGMVKGIPIVGTWISYLIFGGEFPGTEIVGRLYSAAHPAAARRSSSRSSACTHHPAHRTSTPSSRAPVAPAMCRRADLPVFAAKAGGFFFIVFGVIILVAATLRSTRSGTTDPTIPPRSPPEPSPTGTSASPTARCDSSPRAGSS